MLRLILATFGVACLLSSAEAQQAQQAERPVDMAVIKRLAEQAEPGLKGQSDRLAQYVATFGSDMTNDVRLCAFSVTAEAEGQRGVRLRGFVEFPETRAALQQYFVTLGFKPVENQLETLPGAELGERRFGFIKSDHSLSYAEPAEREIVTDCLLGEPLFLLRKADDHFLVHGGDGYLGYVASRDIHEVGEAAFAEYLKGPRVCVRADHEVDGVRLLAGSRLKWVRQEGDNVVGERPTGEPISLPTAACDVRDLPADKIDVVCANARQLLGTKYLWGGKTSSGIDCSGLVQISFAGVGVTVPRDSTQQFHMGRLTGTRWSRVAMRRGDTLYFINPQGRISHTGLYLGDDQFIHAISPVVVVNSFNPKDENYDPARHASFAFARRLWE